MNSLTRRHVLAGGAASIGLGVAGWPLRGLAAEAPLQVFCHRTHETTATTGPGGDVAGEWAAANDISIQWTGFDIQPLEERVLRELSLGETSLDVAFMLNPQITPNLAELVEPLGAYMQSDPIEDPADIFQGLYDSMSVAGSLLAMPSRAAVAGFHYNQVILAERGFPNGPQSMEELVEIAKACTYEREGQKVVGLALPLTYQQIVQLAHAWDGDIVTPDFRCVADQPGMVAAMKMIVDLYEHGAIPRNAATLGTEDAITLMQTGRAAMYTGGFSRYVALNDPARSQFPGKIIPMPMPVSQSLAGKYKVAPGEMEVWGMVIPRNSKRKDLAWSFIKALSSVSAQKRMQLNGNGAVRASTYADPEVKAALPFADAALASLVNGRVPMPAFEEALRAADVFKQQAELAVLGQISAEDAMTAACADITTLLPG